MEDIGYSFSDVHKLHRDVITKLMEKDTQVGNKLRSLCERRVDADYKMNADINEDSAKACTKLSSLIINSIDSTKKLRR